MARFLHTLALVSTIPLSVPLGAQAHMEMSWPYPFRSKFDPAITDPDYDNTFPLSSDGSNYPCRGYQNLASSQVSKVIYQPGETYNITLAGGATHMGGSCQISLSYDNGQSFKVIKSMIGGCPLKPNWDFTVPSYAPASDGAILAWTWFNLIGNREMYMNCARVTITGQSVQRRGRYQSKRQSSLSALPDTFACNIGNGCQTIERREVVFPNPGPVIETNADAVVPDPGPGFTLTSTPTGDAFSSVAPNATAPTASYPYPNATVTTAYTGPAGTGLASTTTTTFTSTYSSVAFFNSTSLLTVSSSTTTPTSTTTTTSPFGSTTPNTSLTTTPPVTSVVLTTSTSTSTPTSTTPTVAAGFFYPINSTNTSTTITITPIVTATAPFLNYTTYAPLPNTTSTSTLTPSNSSLSINSTTSTLSSFNLTTTVTATPTSASQTTTTSSAIRSSLISSTFTTVTMTTTTSSLVPSATIIATSCSPGSFACNSTTTFSQCIANGSGSGTYVYMGSVAAGTQCVNNTIVRQNAGPCTPNGSLQCNGETAFFICDQGGLINMGSVAPGTACRNGVIVFS